jgi:23S rRNA pseudouridine2457 synthase
VSEVLALWKPYGVVSRFTPAGGHPGLATLIERSGVWPIGRLDHDSEGLLLLGDDGGLAHRLTDPRFAHPRTYWVQVEREPDAAALAALADGVVVGGRRTRPAEVRRLREEPALPPRPVPIRFRKRVPTAWLELTLREGRNRQVRRMTAAVGHPTLRLVRVAIGPLHLLALGLAPGCWRELTEPERRALYASVAAKPASASRPRAKRSGSGSRLTTR